MRGEHLLAAAARERRPARDELIAHHTHRVDVGTVVDRRIGGGLLRRHVDRRAESDPGGGELLPSRCFAHRLGDPEVGHQRVLPGEEHVVRLDVAVHHALRVREGERVRYLDQDPDRIVDRQLAPAVEPGAERLAGHVGHDVVEESAGLAGVVQRQDVRVLQHGGKLDLAQEALGAERGGQLGPEHLHGDVALVPEIAREVHGGHAALPELALDGVAVGQGSGERVSCGHKVVGLRGLECVMGGVGLPAISSIPSHCESTLRAAQGRLRTEAILQITRSLESALCRSVFQID